MVLPGGFKKAAIPLSMAEALLRLEELAGLSSPRSRRDRVPMVRPRSLQGVYEASSSYTQSHSHHSTRHEGDHQQNQVEVAHQFAADQREALRIRREKAAHHRAHSKQRALKQLKINQELDAENAIAKHLGLFRQAVAQDCVSSVIAASMERVVAQILQQAELRQQEVQHRCTAKTVMHRAWRSHRVRKFSRALVELVFSKRTAEAEEDQRIDQVYRVSMAQKLAHEWPFLSSLRSPRNDIKPPGPPFVASSVVLLPVDRPSVSHQLLKKLLSARVNRMRVAEGLGMLSRRERELWGAELRECEERRFASREASALELEVESLPTLCLASGLEPPRERPSTETNASSQPAAAASSPESAHRRLPTRPRHAPPSAVRARPQPQPRQGPHTKAKGPTREVAYPQSREIWKKAVPEPEPAKVDRLLRPTPPQPREPRPRPGAYCLTSADSDWESVAPVYLAPLLALQRQFGRHGGNSEGESHLAKGGPVETWEDRALCYRDTRNEVLALGRGGWGGCNDATSALVYDSPTSAAASIAARAVVAHAVAMAIEFHLTRGGPTSMVRHEEGNNVTGGEGRSKSAQLSPAEIVAQLRALPRQGRDGRIQRSDRVGSRSATAASSTEAPAWERIIDEVYSRSLAHHNTQVRQSPRRLCLTYGDYVDDRSGGGWIVSLDGHTKMESHTCPLLTV